MPNAFAKPQRALRLQLYGSLAPSRSNAPLPRVSTLTALASPGGMALRKARLECACLVQDRGDNRLALCLISALLFKRGFNYSS